MAESSSVFYKTKKLKKYIASAYNPPLSLPLVFVLPSTRRFRQALGTIAAIAVFVIPDATAMRQTFLCEVYDFPPNVRILVKLPSQRENSALISSVISSNKRAAGSLQQSSGSSENRRVSAPYFQSPSGSDHRFTESLRLENGGKPTSCGIQYSHTPSEYTGSHRVSQADGLGSILFRLFRVSHICFLFLKKSDATNHFSSSSIYAVSLDSQGTSWASQNLEFRFSRSC